MNRKSNKEFTDALESLWLATGCIELTKIIIKIWDEGQGIPSPKEVKKFNLLIQEVRRR